MRFRASDVGHLSVEDGQARRIARATRPRLLARHNWLMPWLWAYPPGPLRPEVEYSVEIEADDHGVLVMVGRNSLEVPGHRGHCRR